MEPQKTQKRPEFPSRSNAVAGYAELLNRLKKRHHSQGLLRDSQGKCVPLLPRFLASSAAYQ